MKSYKMVCQVEKVYIKSFSGGSVECMMDYIKPSLKYNPGAIFLHCGMDDLQTGKRAEEIATNIINLAKKMII